MVTHFQEVRTKLIKLANDKTQGQPKLKSKVLSQFIDDSDPLNIRFNKRSYSRYSKLGPSSIICDKFNQS